jgi:DNA-binding response OmpR family regulator
MTGHNRLSDRLMAARFGSRAFVQKPISAEQLIETVIQTLQPVQPEQVYLLVVDDDPVILDHISSLLQPWGIEVITLQEPAHFWDILESVVPDLLILDIEMPDISGADLCQIVRNDSYWSDIPILMLSAHRDTETICQLFALGADDYVSKPIVEPELVARVLNRLERASTRNRPARAHNRTYVNCPRSNSSPFPESSS